jgi:hypothetical protein
MVTKPGLIGNGRKTIFGEGALESFSKNCALQTLNVDKRKPARFEMDQPVSDCKIDRSFWTNPATRRGSNPKEKSNDRH